MSFLFKSSRHLENQIDEMLDAISQGMIIFEEAIGYYFCNDCDQFSAHIERIDKLESKTDSLRRNIENDLYQHSLIPEHRGDVLGLLESIDEVIDNAKQTLYQFDVERPYYYDEISENFKELASAATKAAEALVLATRAFFKNVNAVKDHLHKVYFYEKEADSIAHKLKKHIFAKQDLELAKKMHLRYFALHIDNLADISESVADRLSIYTIKRNI